MMLFQLQTTETSQQNFPVDSLIQSSTTTNHAGFGHRRFSMTFSETPTAPFKSPATSHSASLRYSGGMVRTVILRRCGPNPTVWGIKIASCRPPDELQIVVMVTKVTPESPAWSAGLKEGDRLLCVNGKDLSQATQEEALEAFSTAQEPIIVQVARQRPTAAAQSWGQAGNLPPLKIPPPPTKPLPAPPTLENATITKPLHHHRRLRCLASAPLPESETAQQRRQHLQHLDRPGFRQPLCLSSSSQDLILGDAVEQLYQLADRETSDYQEVTIHRSPSYSQKLGLTLFYSQRPPSEGPASSDVFVESVESGSPAAAAMPSIRVGDRIVRINGQPVLSRDQTVRLFTESGRTVNLLVSRPSPGCSPSFSNSSPSTDDSRFYSNYAVYDVATIEEPKAPANPAAMTSRARPSRGHVPRMGTKGLPPASQQHQPPAPPPPPLLPQQHQQVATNTEWVVKRRPDGSRYVTRRPAKAKLRRAPGHPRAPAPAVDNDVDEQRGGEASGCDQADSSGDSAEIAEGVQKQRKRLTMAKLQLPEMQRQQSQLVPVAII
ncbi:hypothetical protein BOX15_Mlig008308g2 [Macrostomum lignano]|uniref:PDZ domain-containing protein n=1 Tax=Macrostomum lignano TaxID=282301 RepID=A0A267G3J2_9PLAT|nr:hypothetical protein BOX15_Mlig008308g2 [Macrostomum lignano]